MGVGAVADQNAKLSWLAQLGVESLPPAEGDPAPGGGAPGGEPEASYTPNEASAEEGGQSSMPSAPPAPAEAPNASPSDPDAPATPPDDEGPNYTPSPPADNGPAMTPNEPVAVSTPLDPAVPGVAETIEVPVEFPKTKIWGGKVEIAWKITVEFTGVFLPDQGSQVTMGYSTKEGMVKKLAHKWSLETFLKEIGAPNFLTDVKLGVEGKISDVKGISIKAGAAISGKYGTGEVNGILVKKEPGKDAVYGAVELSFKTPKGKIVDYKEDGINVAQITVLGKASATVEPQWVKILADAALKEAETAAVEGGGAGGLATAGAILDVAIPAALAAVAIGTVFGVADMFARKAAMADMGASLAEGIRGLRGGLYDGLANRPNAGGNELYAQGWQIGNGAYMAAVAKLAQLPELPPPDEIAEAAQAAAKKSVAAWRGFNEVEDRLRWGFFNRWVDENHGPTTFRGHAQAAVQMCWGGPPEASDGPHMKVWVARSVLPDILKT